MFVWTKHVKPAAREDWERRLHSTENAGLVITERPNTSSVRVDVYCPTEADAEAIRKQFGGKVARLVERDWVALSAPEVHPVKIRDRFVVTPERDPAKRRALEADNPGREVLTIPAEMAFGTGDHATTATCLRFLCDLASQDELPPGFTLLDLGCGTGILSIAAMKLGASRAVGYDFDPAAVAISKRNAEANGLSGSDAQFACVDVLGWDPETRYDVIVANLFSDILAAVFPKVKACLNGRGHVIVSGILEEHAEECLDAGSDAGLHFREKRQRGKWVTALAGHASPSGDAG